MWLKLITITLTGLFLQGISVVSAKSLKIGMPQTIPPYVIAGQDTGIQVELVKAALNEKGYTVQIEYYPNKRLPVAFEQRMLDGSTHIKEKFGLDGYYTQPVMGLHNYAVSLKSSLKDIPSIDKIFQKYEKSMSFDRRTFYFAGCYYGLLPQSCKNIGVADN